jgi:hypothetical protein
MSDCRFHVHSLFRRCENGMTTFDYIRMAEAERLHAAPVNLGHVEAVRHLTALPVTDEAGRAEVQRQIEAAERRERDIRDEIEFDRRWADAEHE